MKNYLKRAFLYRWNLLVFLGGVAAAVLSPWPDALLPLVAAAEGTYLALVVASPRFRSAVDAQVHKESKQEQVGERARTTQAMLSGLPLESRRRFEQLRARCLEMRAIADGVRGGTQAGDTLSTASLDRLLWVFLKLLVSEEALNRFCQRTDVNEIRARLEELKSKLAAQAGGDERILHSLQDSVAAQELRLENYQKVEKNTEFVRAELDRIEAKIHALTEASVNRQDPDFLSSQIDSVAESIQTSEKAISELQHITGMVDELQEPPAILEGS